MRRTTKFLPLAVVGALAILALLLTSGDQAKAAYLTADPVPGQVADVSADMDTTGNGSVRVAVLGAPGVDSTIGNIPVGATHDIDIVVDEIAAADGSSGFALNILFDPAIINITANNFRINFPFAIDFSGGANPLPNASGNYRTDVVEIPPGGGLSGEIILTRVTVQCVGEGTSVFDVNDTLMGDGLPNVFNGNGAPLAGPVTAGDGVIGCGEPCANLTDVEVVSAIVSTPPGTTVGTPFDVTVDGTVQNNGPFGPVTTDVAATLTPPADCQVDGNSAGQAVTKTALEDESLEITPPAAPTDIPQQTFSVTCAVPSFHDFEAAVTATIDHEGVCDCNLNNNTYPTSVVQNVITGDADLSVQTVTVSGPASGTTGTPFNVSVDAVLANDASFDVNADVTVSLSTPPDCTDPADKLVDYTTISGTSSIPQQTFTVTCTERSDHTFIADVTVAEDALHVTDPNGENDSNSGQGSVPVFDLTDIRVDSVIVGAPATKLVNTAFDVTADVTLTNLSGLDSVNVDTTITLFLPEDCTIDPQTSDPNPDTEEDTTVSQAAPVSLSQRSWSVTCMQHSTHIFSIDVSTAIDQTHVSDSNSANNSASGQASAAITVEADLTMDSVSVTADPAGQATVDVPFDVQADVTVDNLGPYGPAGAVTTVTLTLPPDCSTGDPNPDSIFSSVPAPGPLPLPTVTWSVTCTLDSGHTFVAEATTAVDQLHVSDPNAGNNGPLSGQDTIPVVPDADGDGIGDPFDSEGPSPNSNGVAGQDDCSDGVDNDGDGLIDAFDTGCDSDGDGVPQAFDACPTLAEDIDGFQDADGCPDTDNDMDGVCDPWVTPSLPSCTGSDSCPNVPEDFDAFHDEDGCPEPDNDADGFPDATDECPATDYTAGPDGDPSTLADNPLDDFGVPIDTREDYDGVIDTDGCHDSPGDDYDGDGLSDEEEVFTFLTDPTETDTDGDGIEDGVDGLNFGGDQGTTLSSNFADAPGGTTFGIITDTGGTLVSVTDAPDPEGVKIRVNGFGGPATIDACDVTISMPVGTEITVTCGSAVVQVIKGPITVDLETFEARVPSATTITVEEVATGVFDVSNSVGSASSISVGGLLLSPGETATGVEDGDGDGVVDRVDNCPSVATVWWVPAGDTDCDGFTTDDENFMGTLTLAACMDTATADDEDPPDAWPYDFNDDQRAALADVLGFIPVFNTFPPGPPYDPRHDLNADNGITLADVLSYIPVFNQTCTP